MLIGISIFFGLNRFNNENGQQNNRSINPIVDLKMGSTNCSVDDANADVAGQQQQQHVGHIGN
ncbi:hypothetical protein DERF_013650 [Dermatophagoides farinae]|uniref:Uncharacterized protein n=1 Tax=Dermatophagoides farinae TaxID=6954 RepID=A0A922KWS2_DERFA|nr:hypothetical protein DERF_013650 [Dermatophagoides farinae]